VTRDVQLAELEAGGVGDRQVDLPSAEQAAKRLGHLDVEKRRRVDVAQQRPVLHL